MPTKGRKKASKNQEVEASNASIIDNTPKDVYANVSPEELDFLRQQVSLTWQAPKDSDKKSSRKQEENVFISRAVETLSRFHFCILHNVLAEEEILAIQDEYTRLLDVKYGAHAIGEKDPSKRSGTRMFNCPCQLGPKCQFEGWKAGSSVTKEILERGRLVSSSQVPIWQRVCNSFGFSHIARVEVVTSHVGCRRQDWHCDSAHGITVIFPLVDVDMAKGPTELEFTTPFNSLDEAGSKIKEKDTVAPDSVHAVMPRGSVLLFNANTNHRGTENISHSDRPILVLDTSPSCEHLEGTCWECEVPPPAHAEHIEQGGDAENA